MKFYRLDDDASSPRSTRRRTTVLRATAPRSRAHASSRRSSTGVGPRPQRRPRRLRAARGRGPVRPKLQQESDVRCRGRTPSVPRSTPWLSTWQLVNRHKPPARLPRRRAGGPRLTAPPHPLDLGRPTRGSDVRRSSGRSRSTRPRRRSSTSTAAARWMRFWLTTVAAELAGHRAHPRRGASRPGWRIRFGAAAIEELRAALHPFVEAAPACLPLFMPVLDYCGGLRASGGTDDRRGSLTSHPVTGSIEPGRSNTASQTTGTATRTRSR